MRVVENGKWRMREARAGRSHYDNLVGSAPDLPTPASWCASLAIAAPTTTTTTTTHQNEHQHHHEHQHTSQRRTGRGGGGRKQATINRETGNEGRKWGRKARGDDASPMFHLHPPMFQPPIAKHQPLTTEYQAQTTASWRSPSSTRYPGLGIRDSGFGARTYALVTGDAIAGPCTTRHRQLNTQPATRRDVYVKRRASARRTGTRRGAWRDETRHDGTRRDERRNRETGKQRKTMREKERDV